MQHTHNATLILYLLFIKYASMDNRTQRYRIHQPIRYSFPTAARQDQALIPTQTRKPTSNADGGTHLYRLSKSRKGDIYQLTGTPGPGSYVQSSTVCSLLSSEGQGMDSKESMKMPTKSSKPPQGQDYTLHPTPIDRGTLILNTQSREGLHLPTQNDLQAQEHI